jgi:taurine dioxygenase
VTITITPLTGAIGAEVRGVDLRSMTDDEWAEVHAAWLEHLVAFFPDQHLSPDEHIAFARRFGEIEIHPFLPKQAEERPEIAVLDAADGGGAADTWHTDVTFSPTPPKASILSMQVLPRRGGDTLWLSQHAAYESLSAPLREFLGTLTAVHTGTRFGHPEVVARHPIVTIHPETGRPGLFVNRTFTSHIPELRRAESDALLAHLYSWAERPDHQCRYRWAEGTVGVWDNRATQHYAVGDYADRRLIHRVTVLGTAPVGGEPRWDEFVDPKEARRAALATTPAPVDHRANSVDAD